MDIQISSNFERILFELTGRDPKKLLSWMQEFKTSGQFSVSPSEVEAIRAEFTAQRCSDEQTLDMISRTYRDHQCIIDPHTAVGLHALEQSGYMHHIPCVALACAHPAKFPDVVRAATGVSPERPASLADLMTRPESYQVMACDYAAFRSYVLKV